jgi:dTMP kinase
LNTGRLISLEGLDGVGKTTQALLLRDYCLSRGWETEIYREPGGTSLGEELRRLLKSGLAASPGAELFLFGAARSELLYERVEPALAAGRTVILDRFTDSLLAYQGALGVFPEEQLQMVARLAARGLSPDLTIWLDLPADQALKRRSAANLALALSDVGSPGEVGENTGLDAFEQRDLAYFTAVRERYKSFAAAEPQRIHRIDAAQGVDATAAAVRASINKLWPI